MLRTPLIHVMTQAARKAGRSLARDFGEVEKLQSSIKGPGDFVSAPDHRSEEILYRELSRARPAFGFVMEERGRVEGTDRSHTWLVDPLDGTLNFLHGIPHFAVSIGLERNGLLIAAVIYNPVTDELYTAERGSGAYLNDRRLRVSGRRTLADCVVLFGVPPAMREELGLHFGELRALMPRVAGLRRTGSAALDVAWVAAGRADAFFEHRLSPWDLAAGIVLVREAGGTVSNLAGGETILQTGDVLAANEEIHRALLPLLRDAKE